MAEDSLMVGNYRLGKNLGIGAFGKVKHATNVVTGHHVAIKILNRQRIRALDMQEKVKREINILKKCSHPHIIRLYEVIDTPTDIFVVMEYVSNGELFDYIVSKGRLAPDEARRFFHQIVAGVEYCHFHNIVHRDLKPENLLLDADNNLKIADFGLSNTMRDGEFLRTSCGSPNYAAPEVISGNLYAGPEVDVWSCGVILYALLCGSLPFDDESIPNLFKKIKSGMYSLPSHLSSVSRDLIPRMLVVDPMKRITIPEIRMHPWSGSHHHHAAPASLQHHQHHHYEFRYHQTSTTTRTVAAQRHRHHHHHQLHQLQQLSPNTTDARASRVALACGGLCLGRFTHKLPPYLHHTPDMIEQRDKVLDLDTVDEVCRLPRLNATRDKVEAAVMHRRGRTDVRVAYELILDSKKMRQRAAELAMAQQASAVSTPPAFSSSSGTASPASAAGTPPAMAMQMQVQHQQRAEQATACLSRANGSQPVAGGQGSNNSSGRRRRWYLGIQSKKEPAHVMTEVYKALAALGCDWRIMDSYRIKCRWMVRQPARSMGPPPLPNLSFGQAAPMLPVDNSQVITITIFLTLYKVQSSIYLLDFQRKEGNPFDFMTLCARIITELKALSQASRQMTLHHHHQLAQLAQQQQQLLQQQAQQAHLAGHAMDVSRAPHPAGAAAAQVEPRAAQAMMRPPGHQVMPAGHPPPGTMNFS